MPQPNPADRVTVQAAADYYNVSTKTIRRMIARGDIYAERIGPRLIRVDLASLESAGRPLRYTGR